MDCGIRRDGVEFCHGQCSGRSLNSARSSGRCAIPCPSHAVLNAAVGFVQSVAVLRSQSCVDLVMCCAALLYWCSCSR